MTLLDRVVLKVCRVYPSWIHLGQYCITISWYPSYHATWDEFKPLPTPRFKPILKAKLIPGETWIHAGVILKGREYSITIVYTGVRIILYVAFGSRTLTITTYKPSKC